MQYLRAVAALLVVASHLDGYLAASGLGIGLAAYGAAGVYIFFVISGFVIWYSARADASIGRFYWRRVVRIVPLYWLLLSVLIVIVHARFLGPGAGKWMEHTAASYLFIAWPYPGEAGLVAPPLVPGWSLNYEMMFYAIFGALLMVPERWRLASLFTVLGSVIAIGQFTAPVQPQLQFYSSPMILLFAMGAGLAVMAARGVSISLIPACLSMVAGFVLLGGPLNIDLAAQVGAGSVLIVGAAVLYEAGNTVARLRFGLVLGDASYSIYLVHTIVLMVLAAGFRATIGLEDPVSAGVFGLVSLAVILAASLALYFGFERPILALLRRSPAKVTTGA